MAESSFWRFRRGLLVIRVNEIVKASTIRREMASDSWPLTAREHRVVLWRRIKGA
jgi:hypothetical protein